MSHGPGLIPYLSLLPPCLTHIQLGQNSVSDIYPIANTSQAPTRSLQASRSRDHPLSVRSTCAFFPYPPSKYTITSDRFAGAALPSSPNRTFELSEDLLAAVAKITLGVNLESSCTTRIVGWGRNPPTTATVVCQSCLIRSEGSSKYMHRTELVNMIKVVRLLAFLALFVMAYPLLAITTLSLLR